MKLTSLGTTMRPLAWLIASFGCLSATNVMAQTNIQIYGLIDANVTMVNHANANGDNQLKVNSGGMNTSRFGFKGTEEIVKGLKAFMQLEGGVVLDSGASDGDLFGRQANVGLQGEFGKLSLGRSFSTTYDFMNNLDPMAYSQQYSWATSAGATGSRKDGMLTGISNQIKYLYETKGFKIGASYGAGETAGNNRANSKYNLAASVSEAGWTGTLTYEVNNGALAANNAMDKTTTWHLGGKYEDKDFSIYAAMRNFKKSLATGAAEQQSNLVWVGASYKYDANWTLTAAYYMQDIKNVAAGKDADPSLLSMRAKYAASKRTDLYLAMGYAKAKNGMATGVSRDDVGFISNQTSVTAGIQHRF